MQRTLVDVERETVRGALYSCEDAIEEIRLDYSGRGMHGATCFGVVTNDPLRVLGTISCQLGIMACEDVAIDFYSNACMDGMGLSEILYFPDIDWGREEDASDVHAFVNRDDYDYEED